MAASGGLNCCSALESVQRRLSAVVEVPLSETGDAKWAGGSGREQQQRQRRAAESAEPLSPERQCVVAVLLVDLQRSRLRAKQAAFPFNVRHALMSLCLVPTLSLAVADGLLYSHPLDVSSVHVLSGSVGVVRWWSEAAMDTACRCACMVRVRGRVATAAQSRPATACPSSQLDYSPSATLCLSLPTSGSAASQAVAVRLLSVDGRLHYAAVFGHAVHSAVRWRRRAERAR